MVRWLDNVLVACIAEIKITMHVVVGCLHPSNYVRLNFELQGVNSTLRHVCLPLQLCRWVAPERAGAPSDRAFLAWASRCRGSVSSHLPFESGRLERRSAAADVSARVAFTLGSYRVETPREPAMLVCGCCYCYHLLCRRFKRFSKRVLGHSRGTVRSAM